ncbi:MAG: hypothetical protein JWR26_1904 [Pedosphaera sp.]|nr:hypothetical protein [Pedosphaera sp.]
MAAKTNCALRTFFKAQIKHNALASMNILTTVVPVYNGEAYIARTLQSVARQSRRPDRLVVLDNCSTDGTRQIVEQFREMPCEWRQNEKNLGLFGNLNRALEFAPQTEYLHLLHADDLVKPDFYQNSMSKLAAKTGRALIYCQTELIDENDHVISQPRFDPTSTPLNVSVKEFVAAQTELRKFYFPCVLLKTSAQPSPCQFHPDIPQLADQLFWAEWAAQSDWVAEIGEILCQYRFHPGNDTKRNMSSLQSWVLDEWRVMQLICQLLGETGLHRWLRQQKLKILFSARSHVKIKQVKANSPEFAAEIRRVTRETVSAWHWHAGGLAVWLRDELGRGERPVQPKSLI